MDRQYFTKRRIKSQNKWRCISFISTNKTSNEFRQKDLENNGQIAPLTPIFHYLISKRLKISLI